MSGSRLVAAAVAATFAFFPLYASLGLLYVDPHAGLPPEVWLVPRPLVWAFVAVSGLAFAAIAAGALRWRRPLPALFWPGTIGALGFVPAALFGFEPGSGLVLALAFFVWMLGAAALERVRAREPWVASAALATLLGSGALACALAVVLVTLRRPAALYAFNHGRAIGTFLNTNELAGYAVVLCATAFGCALAARERALRILGWVALVCGLAALVATFSRSGFIGAFVALGILLVVFRARPLAAAGIVVAALAVAGGALAFDVHHNPGESFSRLAAWSAGWRTFERFPLTGVGAIAYHRTYPVVRPPDGPAPGTPISFDPHDVFLTLLSELGLVGCAAIAYLWWRWLGIYRTALAGADARARRLSLAIAAGLAGLWAVSLFNTLSMLFALWANFMGLAVVTAEDGRDRAPRE